MSFGCNLGAAIERAKISSLTDAIVRYMGVQPRVFKAGRYGFGETTAEILESLGFTWMPASSRTWTSPASRARRSWASASARARFGDARRMLELPCTTGFVGLARGRWASPLHRAASAPDWLKPTRAVGILARTGLLNKVMLSPEGNTLDEMKALTRALHADGLRTFAMTFHSPSLKPGCTRYVRTDCRTRSVSEDDRRVL